MSTIQILRAALRSLTRTRGFAATAILTLALGIGLAIAVFTVADALLLRKLPVQDQDGLVTLWGETRDHTFPNFPLTRRQAREFATTATTVRGVAFFAYEGAWPLAIRDGDNLTRLKRALVSGNYFDVLGARPLLGRSLQPSDDVVGAAPVAVITAATWRRRFGSDPNIVGHRFTSVEFGTTYSVVGVMPAGLEYPHGVDFWAPFVPARLKSETDSASYTALDLVARLAPNASIDAARSELTGFFARTGTTPWTRNLRGVATSLPRIVLGDTRPAVLAFAVAAALLLLITCINVANLLLVRGLGRTREIAVRSALGAGRAQLVAQLLAENAVLAVVGGVLGVAVAAGAVQGFLTLAPDNVPLLGTVELNMSAALAAATITGVAMLLFGLAPALVSARADVQEVLRSGTRQSGSTRSRLARELLVSAQVALAVVMLSAAALLGRSLLKLERANLAFDASRVVIGELALRLDRYDTPDKQLPLLRQLVSAVRATPGVESVSPVVAVPFSGTGGWDGRAAVDGQTTADVATNPMFNMELVSPEYFETFDIRITRGRALSDADAQGAEPVVVISESVALRYWPGEDAVGKHMRMGPRLAQSLTVVGIVPDTRYRDLRTARATVYFPLAQSFFPYAPTTLAVRTSGPQATVMAALRRTVNEAAPGVELASVAPFSSYLQGPLALPRFNTFLLGVFAAAALTLAGVGLFGTMTTTVRQRTREVGVRMALGATAHDVLTLVLGRALAISGAGAAVGLIGALTANRWLASLLYEVRPTDAATLGGVTLLLLVVAALATLIPARASARIDPAIALRVDD